jgi:2-C-methyl-D-erythritol 2,4-cyclodiphosphate synthase
MPDPSLNATAPAPTSAHDTAHNAAALAAMLMDLRVGHGYDLHRLEPRPPMGAGRQFVLGGVQLAHDHGPIAHSDGDALLHAVTDAVLSAAGQPDIGQLFPDTDPRHASQDSREFLREAARRVRGLGFVVLHVDCTVILERPKLSPHKQAMIETIAHELSIPASRVGLKGKTHEKVDAVGEGRAVEVHVVAMLTKETRA